MRYFIIAGEPSGDIYGAELIRGILATDSDAELQFYGGARMAEQAGKEPLLHIEKLSIMAFWEVIVRLPSLLSRLRKCKQQISDFNPDAVIFIDFAGFNLRIAHWAKDNGFSTFYYIAPKTWAWKENRVKKLRKYIDHVYAILPFEEGYFSSHGISVSYHGHPLKEVIQDHKTRLEKPDKFTVGLLPGSRAQEIKYILPAFLKIIKEYPDWDFLLAMAPSSKQEWYDDCMQGRPYPNLTILEDKTYDILDIADLALVASGTATLETALFNTPQVVCYKGNHISYLIAKQFVKVPYVSLVNLILKKGAVTELLQGEMTVANIKSEITKITEGSADEELFTDYKELRRLLQPENSSELIVEDLMGRLEK